MEFIRAVLALIATLGLLGVLAYLAMRFDFASLFNGNPKTKPKSLADFFTPRPDLNRRLSIVEQRILDARTRLMVIRWDDEEHLILVGAGGDARIASKPAPAQSAPATKAESAV